MEAIKFPDDFELYRARANSGGSLFGLLKKHATLQATQSAPAQPVPPHRRKFVRQRSKSLIPRSEPLDDDKSILRALWEYAEEGKRRSQLQNEPRRFSTACIDARDIRARRTLFAARANSPSPLAAPPRPSSPVPSTSTASTTKASSKTDGAKSPTLARRNSSSTMTPAVSPPPKSPVMELKPPLLLAPPSPMAGGSHDFLGPPTDMLCHRRRSFATTPKGIVSEGDEVVPRKHGSVGSHGCSPPNEGRLDCGDRSRASSFNSEGSGRASPVSSDSPCYRVLVLGGPGVGKTALTQQFLTSEYMAAQNTSFDDGLECPVSVLLDGEESDMEFIDLPYTGELNVWKQYDVDGFLIVYSITDRRSFQKAVDLLQEISQHEDSQHRAVVLVGNKSDLVRSRTVGEDEGRTTAANYHAKHIEVSAILNHRVDELLVGVLKHVRESLEAHGTKEGNPVFLPSAETDSDSGCLQKASQNVIDKLLKSSTCASNSCENLEEI